MGVRWRAATAADSFREGEGVIVAEQARGIVVADADAGSETVPVEIRQAKGFANTWDYSHVGDVYDVPIASLSVLRDD